MTESSRSVADRERAIAAGFNDYLPKPLDPASLASAAAVLSGANKR